jgi:hypothetical protein
MNSCAKPQRERTGLNLVQMFSGVSRGDAPIRLQVLIEHLDDLGPHLVLRRSTARLTVGLMGDVGDPGGRFHHQQHRRSLERLAQCRESVSGLRKRQAERQRNGRRNVLRCVERLQPMRIRSMQSVSNLLD